MPDSARHNEAVLTLSPEAYDPEHRFVKKLPQSRTAREIDQIILDVLDEDFSEQRSREKRKNGKIYIFRWGAYYKIGRTTRLREKRRGEVMAECNIPEGELDSIPLSSNYPATHLHVLIEKLIHIELSDCQYELHRSGKKPRHEWFSGEEETIKRVVDHWCRWAATNPFDLDGRLNRYWKYKKRHHPIKSTLPKKRVMRRLLDRFRRKSRMTRPTELQGISSVLHDQGRNSNLSDDEEGDPHRWTKWLSVSRCENFLYLSYRFFSLMRRRPQLGMA